MIQRIDLFRISLSTYDIFNYASIIILFFFFILKVKAFGDVCSYYKKKQSNNKRLAVAFAKLTAIYIVGMLLLWVLNKGFGHLFTNGNANYFGSLTAWFISFYLVPLFFRISPLSVSDLLTSGLPLSLFFAKLACFFHGCCFGFQLEKSFYFNQYTQQYEFPVQLLEALVALVLFFFLQWYFKRNKIVGSVFPVYVIIYSFSRFLTEFFRADLPNVIGPFDAYQLMSFIFLLLGSLLLYVVWVIKYEKERLHSNRKRSKLS